MRITVNNYQYRKFQQCTYIHLFIGEQYLFVIINYKRKKKVEVKTAYICVTLTIKGVLRNQNSSTISFTPN